MSQETNCFSATICLDGREVGHARNQGHGGCNFYDWLDRATGARIERWAKAHEQLDQIIEDLLIKHERLAQLKRWVKKDTVFRLKGQPKGKWFTIKGTYSPKITAYITAKYGDRVELIVDPANLEAGLAYC